MPQSPTRSRPVPSSRPHLLAAAVAALLLCGLAGAARAAPTVRVLLAEGLAATEVELPGAHRVRSATGGVAETPLGLAWPLTVRSGALAAGALPVGGWLELHPLEGLVHWQGRRYRGALRVEATPGGARVINLVDLEDYLRGVVPAEMQASWPLEALKAQAVAARSYTLGALDPRSPWDVCASRECQVYRGADAEHPRSDAAVRDTEGVVLSWNGDVARAYYHADSGGVIASSAEVWGAAVPYLSVRRDVGVASPHRGWSLRLDPATVAATLAETGRSVGTPQAVRVTATSASGRVAEAEVRGTAGSVRVSGPAWTRLARAWGLKSTRFHMAGPLIAVGDGWGHGVGMSQYGARALALQGYEWRRILAFYYPGVGLQRRIYRASP